MFDLEWPVDRGGYRWVEQPARQGTILTEHPARWVIEPCGGPARFYQPLDEEPGLGRKFSALPLPADRAAILDFTNRYGLLDDGFTVELNDLARSIHSLKIATIALDESGPRVAAPLFNKLFHPRFSIALDFAGALPELRIVPNTLYGAMMLQIAQEIAGKVQFRRCRACAEWFAVGKGKATRRKEYCSDRCRAAWRRNHTEEAQTNG
jgi:hypothetical protein